MFLTTTTLFALLLLPIWLTLFMRVSARRSVISQSFGDGGDMVLLQRIRQHGNFVEWVPLVLLLMLLAELQGLGDAWLYSAGALLLLGRLAHPFGLERAMRAIPCAIWAMAPICWPQQSSRLAS